MTEPLLILDFFLNIVTLEIINVIALVEEAWFYIEVMCPTDAGGMENSVDPNQTAHCRSSLI